MIRFSSCLLVLFAVPSLIGLTFASAQTSAADLPTALTGKTISPGIEISYAADNPRQKYENNQTGITPIKTTVYPDGRLKFFIEDGLMKGFMHMDAEFPRYFYAATEFKIANVILEKGDVELILTPLPAGDHVGDIKLMLGNGYHSKSTEELVAAIYKMLRVGQVSVIAPKKPSSDSKPISLDCQAKDAYVERSSSEVVLDEATQSASFTSVGTSRAMQPAVFTDAEIIWNNGIPGPDRTFFTLNRSSGVLIKNRAGTNLYTVHYDCAVRAKKF